MNRRICVIIALFLAVTYLSILDDYPPITADQTTYMLLGASLASGRGYREIWTPSEGPHTTYPPLYPFLLSLIIRFRGFAPFLMRLMNFFFLALALFFLYQLLKSRARPFLAPVLVLMAGIHTGIVWCVYHIFSESAFLFFSLSALFCAERYRRDNRVLSGFGLCAGLCACAALMTRLAGVPLVAALGCYLLIEKPRPGAWGVSLRQALFVMAPALIALGVWSRVALQGGSDSLYLPAFFQHPWDYDLHVGILERITRSLYSYFFYALPHASTGAVFTGRTLVAAAITVVFIVGYARRVKENRSVLEYYTGAYLLIMVLWSGVSGSRRYMVPVIPFVLFYFLEGIFAFARRVVKDAAASKIQRGAALALVAVFLARLLFFMADPVHYRETSPVQAAAFLRSADWISKNTGRKDVIFGIHPPDIYLYAQRASVRFPLETLSQVEMKEFITRNAYEKTAYLLLSSVYDAYGILQAHAYWLYPE